MNKAIIESIEWHKDQLFKLLEDDDFYKIEGDIQSAKSDLNEIIEKAKSKKRVWVKPTAHKKGYYREQEVGRAEGKVGITRGEAKSRDEVRQSKMDSAADAIGKMKSGVKGDAAGELHSIMENLKGSPGGYGQTKVESTSFRLKDAKESIRELIGGIEYTTDYGLSDDQKGKLKSIIGMLK